MHPSDLYKTPSDYEAMMAYYNSQLAEISVPHQLRMVKTRHGQTFVIEAGDPRNPPVACWHGSNANSSMWIPYINHFADRYHIFAADTLGDAGKSDPVRMDKVNSHAYGEWASDVLSSMGIAKAHCLGVSQGAWLIMQLATVSPEKIASASLLSAAGFLPIDIRIIFTMLPVMLFNKPEVAARKFLKLMGMPGSEPTENDVRIFSLLMRFKNENGTPVMRDEDIRCLTAPTQILMTQYEKAYDPYKVLRRAVTLLPNLVHAEIIPGASHGTSEKKNSMFEKIESFIMCHSQDRSPV